MGKRAKEPREWELSRDELPVPCCLFLVPTRTLFLVRAKPVISHLRGRLARKNELTSSVEIDVGGVWYDVELPAFVWRALEDQDVGDELELETFYFLTANAPIPRLIGFQRNVERGFFEKLITVPNVGPTTATKALAFSVSTIAKWIESGDTAALSKLPAIGKRTAETMVAQLRGKVTEEALLADE